MNKITGTAQLKRMFRDHIRTAVFATRRQRVSQREVNLKFLKGYLPGFVKSGLEVSLGMLRSVAHDAIGDLRDPRPEYSNIRLIYKENGSYVSFHAMTQDEKTKLYDSVIKQRGELNETAKQIRDACRSEYGFDPKAVGR